MPDQSLYQALLGWKIMINKRKFLKRYNLLLEGNFYYQLLKHLDISQSLKMLLKDYENDKFSVMEKIKIVSNWPVCKNISM